MKDREWIHCFFYCSKILIFYVNHIICPKPKTLRFSRSLSLTRSVLRCGGRMRYMYITYTPNLFIAKFCKYSDTLSNPVQHAKHEMWCINMFDDAIRGIDFLGMWIWNMMTAPWTFSVINVIVYISISESMCND